MEYGEYKDRALAGWGQEIETNYNNWLDSFSERDDYDSPEFYDEWIDEYSEADELYDEWRDRN